MIKIANTPNKDGNILQAWLPDHPRLNADGIPGRGPYFGNLNLDTLELVLLDDELEIEKTVNTQLTTE